jgi:hypothetical protein
MVGSGTATWRSVHAAATAWPLTVRILPPLANAARVCAAKTSVIDRCHPPLGPLELASGLAAVEPFSGIHQPAKWLSAPLMAPRRGDRMV